MINFDFAKLYNITRYFSDLLSFWPTISISQSGSYKDDILFIFLLKLLWVFFFFYAKVKPLFKNTSSSISH